MLSYLLAPIVTEQWSDANLILVLTSPKVVWPHPGPPITHRVYHLVSVLPMSTCHASTLPSWIHQTSSCFLLTVSPPCSPALLFRKCQLLRCWTPWIDPPGLSSFYFPSLLVFPHLIGVFSFLCVRVFLYVNKSGDSRQSYLFVFTGSSRSYYVS